MRMRREKSIGKPAIFAWTVLAFIAGVTLSPLGWRPHIAGAGFERFAAFAALGFLFSLAYPRRTIMVCVIVLVGAAGLELLQLFTPDRHGRIIDFLIKLAGGFVGAALARVALRWRIALSNRCCI
jgi:hypothetical protein